ncbi:molybdate transporter subunit; periplasmic-binding component of ABC superfamily [Syntrophobacter sp. SbD1]|nr:molybdate transporter subunit; periplasmic-binding component of ABC superfamily [Syntrophobacter sp. SbD1]
MNRKRAPRCLVVIVAFVLTFSFALQAPARAAETVTVFAAASLTNALTEIGKLFEEKKMGGFIASFLSSSTLAKQIENGAPANVFISADEKWMDYLAKEKLIDSSTRFNLLGNRLVLIAPADSKVGEVNISKSFDLAGLLAGGKLAMGDPDHVPAGIYGKEALEKLGVWQSIQGNVARESDVRAALTLVELGEAPLGIVYATDAAVTKKVKVVGTFPEQSHPPIIYPAALVAGNETQVAKSFLEFLKTPQARAVFEKYGFSVR